VAVKLIVVETEVPAAEEVSKLQLEQAILQLLVLHRVIMAAEVS
jgi:hypothetical protein